MIDLLTSADLTDLAERREPLCVSLVLPTEHGHVGAEAAKLRLKNLIADARDRVARQLRPHETDALLDPAEAVLADDRFWRDVAGGLVIYLTPGSSRIGRVAGVVTELGLIADRPAVAPLVHALLPNAEFHLLAISRNHTSVFSGDRHSLVATEIPGLPDSLDDALWYERHENLLNRHGGSHIGSGGRPTSTLHGTAAASDERKDQFERYFRKVDDALIAALAPTSLPLIVAAIEREAVGYQAESRYPHLVEATISGSPDRTTIAELHTRAWEIIRARLDAEAGAACDGYRQQNGTGATSNDAGHIAQLAATGGIETLFFAFGAQRWHDGRELVNDAVSDTLSCGGRVTPLPDLSSLGEPAGVPMAATLRPGRM